MDKPNHQLHVKKCKTKVCRKEEHCCPDDDKCVQYQHYCEPCEGFRCQENWKCLSAEKKCNKYNDCQDGFDEINCTYGGVLGRGVPVHERLFDDGEKAMNVISGAVILSIMFACCCFCICASSKRRRADLSGATDQSGETSSLTHDDSRPLRVPPPAAHAALARPGFPAVPFNDIEANLATNFTPVINNGTATDERSTEPSTSTPLVVDSENEIGISGRHIELDLPPTYDEVMAAKSKFSLPEDLSHS